MSTMAKPPQTCPSCDQPLIDPARKAVALMLYFKTREDAVEFAAAVKEVWHVPIEFLL